MDHRKNCARRERTSATAHQRKLRAIDGHTIGHHFVRHRTPGVQSAVVGRVGFEGQCALDGERVWFASTPSGTQSCARASACADGDGAGYSASAAQPARIDLDHTTTGCRACSVVDHQVTAFNRGAARVDVCAGQLKGAGADLGQCSAVPSYDTGKEGTQVVTAHDEALRGEEDRAIPFYRTDSQIRLNP